MGNDKFRAVAASIDKFVVDSVYWNLFEAERDFYYRLYRNHGGTRPRDMFFDALFTEAYPESMGYEIEADDDSTASDAESIPRAYRAKSGGDYVYDPNGDFFQVRYKDQSGQIIETFYIHRSQFFKPVSYVLEKMSVIALAMAVAFQSSQIQLSQMSDFIREAEMINAKISNLNNVYSDINLLLSTFSDLSNKYAAVSVYPEQHLLERLVDHGFVELDHVIQMGIQFRPILLEIDLTDGSGTDWISFRLTYSAVDKKISAHQYSRKQQTATIKDWVKNSEGDALGQIGGDAAPAFTDADTVAKLISMDDVPIHFDINTARRCLLGGDNSKCFDTTRNGGGWSKGELIQEHEKFGGPYDSGYNKDSRNDFTVAMSRYFMPSASKTVENIIDESLPYLVRLWDVRKYADDIRQKIEYTNNQLQTATTYISMTNQDMQANFSTATNMISTAGQLLSQTGRNVR
jgi:hypothetical protein